MTDVFQSTTVRRHPVSEERVQERKCHTRVRVHLDGLVETATVGDFYDELNSYTARCFVSESRRKRNTIVLQCAPRAKTFTEIILILLE